MITSWASAAARIASRSATSPVDICTALNATAPTVSSIASATRAGGTVVTSSPGWTMNGNSEEVNSTSGTITRVPAGSEAATSPTSPDTVAPIATRSAEVPTSRANAARARSVSSLQPSQLVRPPRHSSSTRCSASQLGRGGRP